jgi:hypothetical protein
VTSVKKIERVDGALYLRLLDGGAVRADLLATLAAATGYPLGSVRTMLKSARTYNNSGHCNDKVLKLNAAMAALEE